MRKEMRLPKLFMCLDVESIGLHGEGFAFGYVIIEDGKEIDSAHRSCHPDKAEGNESGRKWVDVNVPIPKYLEDSPEDVRLSFWSAWKYWKEKGAILFADCGWPVEARFLNQCVEDNLEVREWQGPYPLHDIATFRMALGFDPLGTYPRIKGETPAHNPLADARQSARLLMECFKGRGNSK